MSNKIIAKQRRTIIINAILCIALLLGIVITVCQYLGSIDDPYRQFEDEEFAKAYATALGYESMRDITQEDIDKVESLVYYWSIGNDSSNNYQTYATPVVMLGYKEATDGIIENSEEEPKEGSYVLVNYPIAEVEDIVAFKNLRVLRTFDIAEVSGMQESCYYTQLYAMYGMGNAVTFDSVLSAAALTDLKKLDQLSSLTKLEQMSLEYTSLSNLNGIEKFENLKKLDIGNTVITDLNALSSMTGLVDLSLVQMGDRTVEETEESKAETSESEDKDEEEEDKHTHTGLVDISAIASLTNLESLNLSGNAIVDISAVANMTKLESLTMNSNCIESLSALKNLTALTGLAISDNHVTDISALSGCTALENFYAYDNSIKDISALASCTKLEVISVYDNEIETLGDLGKLTALTSFDAYNNKITDLSALANCTKLTSINAYENEITTIGDLSKLDELTSISIYDNKIADLNGLNGCVKLATINAYNNALTGKLDLSGCTELATLNIYFEEEEEEEEDKTTKTTEEAAKTGLSELVIKGLAKLTSVDAHGNALTAVPDLTGCKALTTLTLNDNLITDVSGAAKDTDSSKDGVQTALTTLNLAGNKITDISALKDATTITSLTLSNNDITNIDAIGKLTTLKTLNLDGNKNLNTLAPIMDNFATTSGLTLNIVGTKVAGDKTTIDEFTKKFTTMKVTYVESTDKK